MNYKYKKRVRLISSGKIELEVYRGAKELSDFKHKNCGTVFSVRLRSFEMNPYCRGCEGSASHQYRKFENQFGEDFKLIEYRGRSASTIQHNKCMRRFTISLKFFRKSPYCRECSVSQKAEAVKRNFKKYTNSEFLLSEYASSTEPIIVFHPKCGGSFSLSNIHIFKKTNKLFCRLCKFEMGKSKKKAQNKTRRKPGEVSFLEQNRERIAERRYEYLGGYVNSVSKIKVKCLECGIKYFVNSANFTNKEVDCKCRNKKVGNQYYRANTRKELSEIWVKKLSTKAAVKEFVFDWGEVEGPKSKVNALHLPCGKSYERFVSNIVRGQCKYCSDKYSPSANEYKKWVEKETSNEYSCIDSYQSNDIKLRFLHTICGTVLTTTPAKFQYEEIRCKMCSEKGSKGERKIREILTKYGTLFVEQYRDPRCKNLSSLPFDFAVVKNLDGDSNSVVFLIEFDGRQHYEPSDLFGGEKGFRQRVKNDEIKTNFCETNEIPLLRVKFDQFIDLEKIIEKWLIKHSVMSNPSNGSTKL